MKQTHFPILCVSWLADIAPDFSPLMGEFSNWKELPMQPFYQSGVWSIELNGVFEGQMYKYVVYGPDGRQEHCDPYGFGMELRPGACSIARRLDAYSFTDKEWMRRRTRCYDKPLNEHPFDGSWGYQSTGFYAPTSRYGTASQLMELIDRLHNAGIGAIMDFVPVHFTVDEYGLKLFDGTPLYEYPHQDVGQSEWGSCNFNHSRREVACFLQSAANYWLKEYHFDGLRMDAVSRLLYWQGDEKRGEPDWELLKLPCHEGFHRFIQQLNHLYQHERCLWNLDHTYAGFKWADRISNEPCVFGYTRTSERQTLLILLNFSDREAALSAEWTKEADVLLHTDWECFGGSTPAHDVNSFVQTIPPFSGLICELPSVTSAE